MFKCSVCDSTSNYPYIGLGGCTLCCQCVTDVRIQMMEDKRRKAWRTFAIILFGLNFWF